jgi:hypothetical protein
MTSPIHKTIPDSFETLNYDFQFFQKNELHEARAPKMHTHVSCTKMLLVTNVDGLFLQCAPPPFLKSNLNLNTSRDEMVSYPFVIKL